MIYNPRVRLLFALFLMAAAAAQQSAPAPAKPDPNQPQVRINYLNVCNPPESDVKEMMAALARAPQRPGFAEDYEVSRGRTTVEEAAAQWVRVRREFPAGGAFLNAQYSISLDATTIIETVVIRTRDNSMQLSLEAQVSAGAASAAAVAAADTPVTRVKLERFGKPSIALVRCPEGDQSKYQGAFQAASSLMAKYRDALGVRGRFRADVARLGASPASAAARKK